jgi:hypothetical protein
MENNIINQTQQPQTKNIWKITAIISIIVAVAFATSTAIFAVRGEKSQGNNISISNETSESTTNNSNSTESETIEIDADRYLVIEEWGIKYRIPDTIYDIRYSVDGDNLRFYPTRLNEPLVFGATMADNDAIYSIDGFMNCLLVSVSRSNIQTNEVGIDGIKLGDYYYHNWTNNGGCEVGNGTWANNTFVHIIYSVQHMVRTPTLL